MAPRQTARRLLVAAPVLALAFAVAACSPPNEQPAEADAPYTLPSYTEDAAPTSSIPETQETDVPEGAGDFEPGVTETGTPGGEGGDEGGGQATTDDGIVVPGTGQQAGNAPAQPAP
ncbi:hypothetical protein SAMN06265174_103111 [Dietzia kunjamensis subsp. schimae]|uniref:Uncharacterized protein n=1 Tax=Dietzia kunjamensis subsp. schimae TaxID=498198 RepID=A0ABY1N2R7_9ACTN|nr:hypothetical protein [Dietzia kunjamensis]SMO64877.1 hypothetical protein SAMN06265174_103111 [Dietzia kunjamensis subsp. schimae]